ncbi:hypothetical protein PG990_014750 [Apiospora arundinis]
MSRNTGEFYSTLEVSHRHDSTQQKKPTPDLTEKIACSPSAGRNTEGLCELGDYKRTSTCYSDSDVISKGQSSRLKQKRFGLSTCEFWIVVIVLNILLTAAIAGGIAGGLLGNRSQSERSSSHRGSDSPEAPSVSGLSTSAPTTSHLNAVSWTGSDGTARRAVFYQRDGTLYVSRTGDTGWVEEPIQLSQDPEDSFDVKNGTPLASASIPRAFFPEGGGGTGGAGTMLFYLDSANRIRDLVSWSDDLRAWEKGRFWNSSVTVGADSNLAVVGHYCPQFCLNSTLVVFQDSEGYLNYIAGNGVRGSGRITEANPGSPLTMFSTPMISMGWVNVAAGMSQVRLLYYRRGQVAEHIFNNKTDFTWNSGAYYATEHIPAPTRAPILTAAPSSVNSLGMVMELWEGGNITLNSLPPSGDWNKPLAGFATIALSQDSFLYAMTKEGSRILEYMWSSTKPDTFWFTKFVR